AEFQKVIWEQTKDDKQPVMKPISYSSNGTGSIQGTINDANGAVISGATVNATNTETSISRSTTADSDGKYFIGNLAVGNYNVKVEANGFKSSTRANVPVTANTIVDVSFIMEVGTVNEAVTVTAEGSDVVNASSQSLSSTVTTREFTVSGQRNFQQLVQMQPGAVTVVTKSGEIKDGEDTPSQKSTPKLREYFPETLVWQPELITNADGKAELKFKMADNITTWKIYTIASTKNGKFGIAEKEVQAFQPFFVDLDPPKFLTEGDEIYLPTQVRNYTPTKQKVDVTMSKSDWFSFLDSDKKQIEVDKNSAKNAVFGFKALKPVKDGKQRVTAIATKDSDAIEKPVTVRPNGEEIVQTDSRLFTNSTQFDINFPANALPKTAKAELKIYPNLMAHVTESVEGLLQRPYACGEQTISSTYPNLMILKFIKGESSLKQKARKYLKVGYERLLGYQVSDGGFSYWGGKSDSDLALTAYALRFLNDAKSFIEVDEKVIENATNYLLKLQREDGSFYKKHYWETAEDKGRAKMTTTYIARTLAMLKSGNDALTNVRASALQKALNYLKSRNNEIDEPYSLALYALANFDSGNLEEAEKTVIRLQSLAKNEGNLVYWNLETNTPFYGWGTAGRIETTALVMQALLEGKRQKVKGKNENDELISKGKRQKVKGKNENDELISKGTMFLLKNKDRYGVWYSTQTTINVLNTFLATLSEVKNQTISVKLDGEKLKDFEVSTEQIEPIILDLSDKLSSANRLEIIGSENSTIMSQIVKTHYIDWKDSQSTNRNVNDSRAIRLDYKCDKLQAKIIETVNCSVEAERIGFQGYGMLLAEIGIPPGADVSRESLEKAFENDWYLSRYEVLPDRIIVYMWAKAGGSKFNFSFKPRYAINAQTPKSIIYDYYNEESRGVVAPLKFEIK
ncbi:MAG: carboxypeptidase regulatory-like domain-containing protein, partial [Pyrinomonadaceae bacterium]|nr:carboxypeptidase regulatory-like domain-containing protein [Pyrinomonadaceae bacterium]